MIILLISLQNHCLKLSLLSSHMLGLQATAIMGGCPTDVISPLEPPEPCVDGGVLEPQVLMVHHTSTGDMTGWSGRLGKSTS
jgi:hypothetical protein